MDVWTCSVWAKSKQIQQNPNAIGVRERCVRKVSHVMHLSPCHPSLMSSITVDYVYWSVSVIVRYVHLTTRCPVHFNGESHLLPLCPGSQLNHWMCVHVLCRVSVVNGWCVAGGDRSSLGSSGSVTSIRSSGSGQSAGSTAHILHAQAEGVKVQH